MLRAVDKVPLVETEVRCSSWLMVNLPSRYKINPKECKKTLELMKLLNKRLTLHLKPTKTKNCSINHNLKFSVITISLKLFRIEVYWILWQVLNNDYNIWLYLASKISRSKKVLNSNRKIIWKTLLWNISCFFAIIEIRSRLLQVEIYWIRTLSNINSVQWKIAQRFKNNGKRIE